MIKTIRNLINNNDDENIAITSSDGSKIKYSELKKHVYDISGQLCKKGFINSDGCKLKP